MASNRRSTILSEYEQIMLGRKTAFTSSFTENNHENVQAVIILWRYVIEEMLGWTPQQASNYLTKEIIERLRLKNTLKKIELPVGVGFAKAPKYVLSLCYPDEIKFSITEQVIAEFDRVLADPSTKFTKNFFADALGFKKATICVNYAIARFLSDKSIHELYAFFANEEKAMEFLTKTRLDFVCNELFFGPLEMFHQTYYRASNMLYQSHCLNKKLQYVS